jgi:TolB-like protein
VIVTLAAPRGSPPAVASIAAAQEREQRFVVNSGRQNDSELVSPSRFCRRIHVPQVRRTGGVLTDTQLAAIEAAERLLTVDRTHPLAWQAIIDVHQARGDQDAVVAAHAAWRDALAERDRSCMDLAECLGPAITGVRHRHYTIRKMTGQQPTSKRWGVRLGIEPLRTLTPGGDDELSIGLFEEMTTGLARVRWLDCILNPGLQSDQGADLDFLLDGTVQPQGDRVRIMVRVRDMQSVGEVVWAGRFDRARTDALTLQDEIASEAVAQIDAELLVRQGARVANLRRGQPSADDLVHQALPAICHVQPTEYRKAGRLLETALAVDPDNASAHAWYAHWHTLLVGQGWAEDPAGATARAGELAQRAVTLGSADARAMTLAGHVRSFLGRHADGACTLHERALALNPNLAVAWCYSGLAHSYLGRHEEAVRRIERARLLSPRDPHAFFFEMALSMPHLMLGDYETAAGHGRRAIEMNPCLSSSYKGHLSALGHLGWEREAAEVRERLLALEPGFNVRNAVERSPLACPQDVECYAEGLRRAGLPV